MVSNSDNNQHNFGFGDHPHHAPGHFVGWAMIGIMVAVFFAFLFGIPVKILWGFTLSPLFNIPEPTYLQAVCIIILARLIFGSFGKTHPRDHRYRVYDKCHHPFQPRQTENDENGLDEKIRSANGRHYQRFWKNDGKQALKEYLQGLKDQKTNKE